MGSVSSAFAAGVYLGPRIHPTAPVGVPPALAAAKVQSCRDDCEQRAILEQLAAPILRACIARCDLDAPPPPPRETPGSITRAPADHRGGLVPDRPMTRSDARR